jgi:hypothetical protein
LFKFFFAACFLRALLAIKSGLFRNLVLLLINGALFLEVEQTIDSVKVNLTFPSLKLWLDLLQLKTLSRPRALLRYSSLQI